MKYKNGTVANIGDQCLAVIKSSVRTGATKKDDKGNLQVVEIPVSSIEIGTIHDFNEKAGTAELRTGKSTSDIVTVAECYSIADAIKALEASPKA